MSSDTTIRSEALSLDLRRRDLMRYTAASAGAAGLASFVASTNRALAADEPTGGQIFRRLHSDRGLFSQSAGRGRGRLHHGGGEHAGADLRRRPDAGTSLSRR